MKKILVYIATAVLLGIVTMIAPFGLFIGKVNEKYEGLYPASTEAMKTPAPTEAMRTFSADIEKQYGIQPATHPLDMFFIVSILASSFAIALGAMRYSKKKTAF